MREELKNFFKQWEAWAFGVLPILLLVVDIILATSIKTKPVLPAGLVYFIYILFLLSFAIMAVGCIVFFCKKKKYLFLAIACVLFIGFFVGFGFSVSYIKPLTEKQAEYNVLYEETISYIDGDGAILHQKITECAEKNEEINQASKKLNISCVCSVSPLIALYIFEAVVKAREKGDKN